MADQKLDELTLIPNATVATDLIYVVRDGVDYKADIANVALDKSQVGLSSVTDDAQATAAIYPNVPPAAAQIPIGNGTAYVNAAVSGDATLAANGALTLANTAVTAAAYGNASHVSVVTVDAKGRITNAVSTAISISASAAGLGSVTNDAQTKAAIVPNDAPAAGEVLVGNAGGTAYAKAAISGDATLATTGALTLANTNVTAGTYTLATVTVDAKGRVTAASNGSATAGGTRTLARFTALDNNPPASNYATFDTRNSLPVLDFDDGSDSASTDEAAIFLSVVPESANIASGINAIVTWAATTSNSGNVVWELSLARLNAGNQDIDSYAFDTATLSANSATNATVGVLTSTTITIAAADTDGISAGDPFAVKLVRKESNAGDSMSLDAEMLSLELRQIA